MKTLRFLLIPAVLFMISPDSDAEWDRIWVGTSSRAAMMQAREIMILDHAAEPNRSFPRYGAESFLVTPSLVNAVLADKKLKSVAGFVEPVGRCSIPGGEIPYEDETVIENGSNGYTPNDPEYNKQWGPPCLSSELFWKYTKGDKSIVLSIIDTGADYTHVDLQGNIDTADDYDFANDDDDAMDDNGHGTHCSGISSAVIDNGTGIAGMFQTTILPVKVLDRFGYGWWDDIAAGIDWARTHGADVISMSLGGSHDPILEQACRAAYDSGVLVFAAAGNDGPLWFNNYPASYTSVIGVGAVGGLWGGVCDRVVYFSSRGFGDHTREGNVEICAPGVKVYSCIPGDTYQNMDGTSMACPHAAAVGALYKSFVPGWSNLKIRLHIQANADEIGNQHTSGYGRIDPFPFID